MKKSSYFASKLLQGWPKPEDIEHYFLGPPGKRWFSESGNDGGSFEIEGVDGTEHLESDWGGRADIRLMLWGNPSLGVLLLWSKWDGRRQHNYASKGDLRQLKKLVRGMHDEPLPAGLFIPFELAWNAVKEFLESDGALPKSIEWIANDDLPPNTFPDP